MSSKRTSPTRLSAHLAVCAGASVSVYTYDDRSPILTLSTGDVTVTIALSTTDLDSTAMRFARDLADAAARFAENCQLFTATPSATEAGETSGPASAAVPSMSRAA
ncbi:MULTISPECIES: hypothetical protein [Pseudofrankia]|uniref:hypothetical protein n=1 Tax=Pseudofrankia TaxID=2994363 RepID=UPI000234C76E|nr:MULTISPECIES: hypothetical protein [Pseudofrankia]OHV41502.1 hypothetical protein BCD49_00630 [Pseudofrankia sp. EUN1h]